MAFHLSFRALVLCRNSSQLPKKPRVPPLLGFARETPLCRSTFCVSTPGSRGFLRPGPARGRDPVPPSWSLTTSTACSTQGLRVCCTPLTTLRFDTFPAGTPRRIPEGLLWRGLRLPRAANRTLRRVPLISSRTASLRPLPSCLCHSLLASGLPGRGRAGCPHRGRSRWLEPAPSAAEAGADTVRLRGPKPAPTRLLPPAEAVGCALPNLRRGARAVQTVRRPRSSPEPRGVRCLSSQPKSLGWRLAAHRSGDRTEELVLCPREAPIRRGGPPLHQTGT